MPLGFGSTHRYDGRASVSSSSSFSSETPYRPYRWGSRFSLHMSNTPDRNQRAQSSSQVSDRPEELEAYKSWLKEHLGLTDDSTGIEKGAILDAGSRSSDTPDIAVAPDVPDGANAMNFSVLQHLNSLPYQGRRPDGLDAVRQSFDDGENRRSPSPYRFKREDTLESILSQDSFATEIPELCTCPIGYTCRSRETGNLLDCRTLVLEWKAWHDRLNEEAHDIHAAVPLQDAPFAKESTIREIRDLLVRFEKLGPTNRHAVIRVIERIRQWNTQMRSSNITAEVLENSQVVIPLEAFLSDNNIQTRTSRNFPIRLEEDMTILLRKWKRGDLICDPNRGLTKVSTRDQNDIELRASYRLDPGWEHYASANFYGEGHLVNGQVFYSRAELMRDGVHSAKIAGISGTVKDGARSVVVGYHDINKNDYYADIDMGTTIDYVGTALKADEDSAEATNISDEAMDTATVFDGDRKPTTCTQMLMTSFRTGNPVRVIRSPKLAKIVKNRPKRCYRYDGLYKVVKMKPLKRHRQIWSFRLQRLPDQGPLRGFEDSEQHPSSQGSRPGYKRYNLEKYAGGRRSSSRSTRRRRSRSPTRQ